MWLGRQEPVPPGGSSDVQFVRFPNLVPIWKPLLHLRTECLCESSPGDLVCLDFRWNTAPNILWVRVSPLVGCALFSTRDEAINKAVNVNRCGKFATEKLS